MKEKIIQIIPAPKNIRAVYENEDNPDRDITSSILCLALTDQGNVWLMDADESGHIAKVDSMASYKGKYSSRSKYKGLMINQTQI